MHFKVNFKPDVVIYHDPCMDGFTAAYAVWCKYGDDVQYVPAKHQEGKDDRAYWKSLVRNKKVVILDFCFPLDMQVDMYYEAESLVVLDHHKSAQEDMEGWEFCHFRMDMSGALITWHAFHDEEPPLLFQYVSDRDLWKWELKDSKAINMFISCTEKTFDDWNGMRYELEPSSFVQPVRHGEAMLMYIEHLVGGLVNDFETWNIAGKEVLAVNSPRLQSEICHEILQRGNHSGAAGCYFIRDGKMIWSLRSDTSTDVSKLAQEFVGGGGHKQSSGFTVNLSEDKVCLISRVIKV